MPWGHLVRGRSLMSLNHRTTGFSGIAVLIARVLRRDACTWRKSHPGVCARLDAVLWRDGESGRHGTI